MARIKTTPMVKFALWALRVYLLILLSLIGLKFARTFSHSGTDEKATATTSAQTNAVPNPSR